MELSHELKAALNAAMANPKLAKMVEELIKSSGAASQVEELESNVDLAEAVAKINELLAALKA